MARGPTGGKFHTLFTVIAAKCPFGGEPFTASAEGHMVAGLSIAMFVALIGFGSRYFGWSDPEGKVQLALITSFILGVIGGFKARG